MSEALFKFTNASVQALPCPAAGRIEYRDSTLSGFRLRVSSSGVKAYNVFCRVKNGDMERVTIGTADKIAAEAARTRAKAIIAGMAAGRSYKSEARAKRGEITLAELVADYIELTPMKPRSKQAYEDLHRRFVKPQLGSYKLTEVTGKKLAVMHRDISVKSAVTANRAVSMVKAAFNWAKKAELWEGSNPASSVKKNQETSRERYLQPAELARFFQALEEAEQPSRDFFLMALLTGARRANVLAMRWRDLDLDEGLWRISAAEGKTGAMVVPLTDEAVKLLEARRTLDAGSEWVFPADSKTGHYQEPKRAWATLRKRAGVEDLWIHDLRRTMGSWLVRTGASTAINAKALGHRSLQAAAVYQRIADTDPVREAMQRATAGIMAGAK